MEPTSWRPGFMPFQSKATAEYAEIETVAGVCLVGKKNSREIQGLCTGTVVSFRGSIVLVTSETVIPSEDFAEVKQHSNKWNKGDYVLFFKSREEGQLKRYDLEKVTESNEGVNFDQGLVIIHLDSEKLSENFKKYRPFKANDRKITDPKPFNDSICRIVKGSARSFEVESYKIMYDKNGKEVLCDDAGSTFDTRSKLIANGAVRDRFAFGGGIFKNGAFVGVLIFDGDNLDQIVPVQCWLGKLVECFHSKTSSTNGNDEFEREDDTSSETGELDEPGNHDTKVGNDKPDQGGELDETESHDSKVGNNIKPDQGGELDETESHDTKEGNNKPDQGSNKSSLAEGESKNGDAISPVISTNDGKSPRDGKPDQSESANGVEAQLGGSRAGCIKKVDPYEGTGAIPKRRNQPKASSSSKDTSAEETDESKEKTDDFSKDKILPSAVQGDSITANIGDPLRDATQDQPVLHNPENSNAIQPDADSITANIGDPPRDAATQDQPVRHNPENSNVSQEPDGDSITANIGDPPRDGTPGQLPKYDVTIKGNPDNMMIGDKNKLIAEAPPRNAATQDRPVRHNPENSNASQEPDGTPGQSPKCRVTIIGHPRNVMIGDHNTLDTRAPPRNVPPSAPDGVSGGETTQSNGDSSSG